MKAVIFSKSLPIADPDALIDYDLPQPSPGEHDLLVKVKAIAVNPVDCKIRKNAAPPVGQTKVLGWDACGVVQAIGAKVTRFKIGDAVFYAGDLNRQGCNAEYQVVDERITGRKPARLSYAESAALPLTSLTAWELLFDRLGLQQGGSADAILMTTGAAGGVGSILVQMASKLTQCRVIATAGRSDSKRWLERLGAHLVVDHNQDLISQVRASEPRLLTHVASLTHTDNHYLKLLELMTPQGRFGLIDDPMNLDIKAFKRKSISVHWEFMFTRSMFQTEDMARQAKILDRVADLIDAGVLVTTLTENLGAINASNLRKAHEKIESGMARGKIVLEGFR
jgi:zinc-binding alcohol dehydrogenase family protein